MKSKMQNKLNREGGFTIIEVLIVLAIAGLILLIVFLAVPALQRNSRNTQYKNQVATYLGAINEWTNNNNGKPPSADADVTAINGLAANGPIIEPTSVTSGAAARTTAVGIGAMELVVGGKCDTTTIGNTNPGTPRDVAIRFSVENSSGGTVQQCVGS